MTADLAQRFANHVRNAERPSLSQAFTGGLLANLGLMALAHALPTQLDKAISTSWSAPLSISEALHKALRFDHHDAGARVARNWRLATALANVMAHHHDLDYRGSDSPLVTLVGAASRYTDPGLERTEPGRDGDEALTRLGVSRSWRDTAIAECARRRDALAAMAGDFA